MRAQESQPALGHGLGNAARAEDVGIAGQQDDDSQKNERDDRCEENVQLAHSRKPRRRVTLAGLRLKPV